jgi:hypothetical protein
VHHMIIRESKNTLLWNRVHNFQWNYFGQTFPLFYVDCCRNRAVVLRDKDSSHLDHEIGYPLFSVLPSDA